ncbi:hypothetical protein C7S14_6453 [Burkholderia cepacia]|nr:hypothetical protein [Burkholderia cepacia]QOH34903.1 hypothetical protein C7S14_6453 [Burkholderia cepacia]
MRAKPFRYAACIARCVPPGSRGASFRSRSASAAGLVRNLCIR